MLHPSKFLPRAFKIAFCSAWTTYGYFVSYKSGSSDEEIQQAEKAVNILGGKIEKTDKFLLPETDMGRALVNIKKIKITPAKYPRKAGMPSREPL